MLTTEEYAAERARRSRRKREKRIYATDAEQRAKRKARCARRHKERYVTDPAYRMKLIEYSRKRRAQ